MVLKFVGVGCRQYFASHWNKLDFLLVCLSIADIIFAEVLATVVPIDVVSAA